MHLELFKFDSCPFCKMVMNFIESNNIKVDYKDIMESSDDLQRLTQDTGRRTVPCLYIDNKPMFESSDIMNWLQNNLSQLERTA